MPDAIRRLDKSTDTFHPELDLDFLQEVNSICERFEDQLRAGSSPRIEDYRVENEAIGARLLPELIQLELEYLKRRDPSFRPDPEEYHDRFPNDREAVVEAISAFQSLYRIPPEQWIGPYELLEELGRGGQGVVYRARRKGLVEAEHMVALKLILPARLASRRDVDHFVAEVGAMVKLNHRGILPVYDSGEEGGQPYVAMKLVGMSLEQALRSRGPLEPDEAARLVAEIARAVDYLHQHGIVHCDLKPSNILLDGDQPLITDFGLSRVLGGEAESASEYARRLEGTIPYMAPEQLRGEPGKPSDIYSLGAVLFELLTRRTPFGSGQSAVGRITHDEAPSSRQFNPSIPVALDLIVRKGLRTDPAARYETAAQLAAELERYRSKEPLVHTPADTVLRGAYLWVCRHRELTTRLAALTAILLLTQFNYFVVLEKDRDPIQHLHVTTVEVLWIIASILFDRLPSVGAWIVIDTVLLTVLLGLLEAGGSSYVVGYPLLIAISGLWAKVRLVWLTTALCLSGYAALVIHAKSRGLPWTSGTKAHDPNVGLAIICVTGYVIALQVERAGAALNAVHARRSHALKDRDHS
jgi:serine/threonine-protein kinase